MCPHNLEQFDKTAEFHLGCSADETNEKLRALAQSVVSTWSLVEANLTELACVFVGGEHRAVVTMLGAITNDGARAAAINAIAVRAFDGDAEGYRLFDLAMGWIGRRRKTRAPYAHSVIGKAIGHPEVLLFVDPRHLVYSAASTRDAVLRDLEWFKQGAIPEERLPELARAVAKKDIKVYSESDIRRDLRHAESSYGLSLIFMRYVTSPASRPAMLHRLSAILDSPAADPAKP